MLRVLKSSRHRPFAAILILTVATAMQAGAKESVRIGSPAPKLDLSFPFAQPSNAALASGHAPGRALILEFWATYCVPCLESAPRLHALMEQFNTAPVDLVAVTDEDETTVRRFLEKHPLGSLVAIDKNSQTTHAFGLAFLPSTVLIDPQGRLAAITTPAHVDANTLTSLVAGKTLGLPLPIVLAHPDDATALLSAVIRPSIEDDGDIVLGDGQLAAQGATIRDLLSRAYGIPARRVEVPANLEAQRYDALIERDGATPDSLLDLLKRTLPAALKLEIRHEERPVPVLVLSAPEGGRVNVRESAAGADSMESGHAGSLQFSATPISHLALALGHILGRDVVDETGLTGHYDLALTWDPQNPESMVDAVRAQLGLAITAGNRPQEFVVVR